MFQRILVTLDGSKLAELARPYAEEIARALNSEVVLVSVCRPGESQYRNMHQLYLKQMAELMRANVKGAKVKGVVIDGRPAEEIINYAEKNGADLIIMTSHARTGIMPWSMGNIANKVMRRVSIPALLVKVADLKIEKGALLSRILIPLDGSEAGEATLPYVRELASKLQSEVFLRQVIPHGQHVHTIGGLDFFLYAEQQIESMKADANQYFEKARGKLSGIKGDVRTEVRVGDAAQEIIKFAQETNSRLVALSTHGHSGVRQWIFGDVAHKVLHASNTPILMVRASGTKV